MRRLSSKIKDFAETYERHVLTASFVIGFLIDWFTLRRIDRLLDNLVLFSYLVLAGTCIALLNLYWGGALRAKAFEHVVPWLPAAMQFAFGGLMSGLVIFYSRSASIWVSWPFLVILAAIFIGNELLRNYYLRLVFQISILFFVLFLLAIFYVPMIVGSMGPWTFFLSGVASLVLIGGFVLAVWRGRRAHLKRGIGTLLWSIAAIYAVVNLFYFANIIPPIPLSLKDSGIYHSVTPAPGGGYSLVRESGKGCFLCLGDTVRITSGSPVYAYSAVFAPTRLSTTIAHRWQYYDVRRGWVTASEIPFPIRGGRDGGYRGYTEKTNVFPGEWRVDVVTGRGQVVGRMRFTIEEAEEPPLLETVLSL